MNKIYIILLNYNGWKDTIECLESVLKNDYENYQVVVVDNNSPNKSMDKLIDWTEGIQNLVYDENSELKHLSQPFEKKPIDYIYYTKEEALKGGDKEKESNLNNFITFIQAGDNGGFATGNNIGMKYALQKNDFEYVWLLNNDTIIDKSSLRSLVQYARGNDIGICGSSLMHYRDSSKVQAYGGSINKFFGTENHILIKEDIEQKLDYVVGASFLINKKVIEKISLLPEEYFLYYEETDYCFNAKQNGFKLGIATGSIVYHKEGGSTEVSEDQKVRSEFHDILALKNRIKFHKKYLGGGIGLWSGLLIAFIIRIRRGQINRVWKVLR